MISLLNKTVENKNHDKPILTDVFYKKTCTKKPIVIFCHGYKGYKDWGAWNLAVSDFVKNNLFFVKFNFSHNGGTVENPIDFPDLEAFGHNNFIIELSDLETIIEWVTTNSDFEEEADFENMTLIGHSRGGGIVTIKASENNKITKVITWSGVSDFGARFPNDEKIIQHWKKEGVSYIENARTKQQMPHYFQFYQSFKDNEERLTIKNAVSKLTIPYLIIHGEEDVVVLPQEAKNLHSWNPRSELIMIEDMNHPLGCTQPWNEPKMPIHLEKAVKFSIDFIFEK